MYIQKYEEQEGQKNENLKNFEVLTFDIQDDLEEAENFVTIIFTITSNQAHIHYLKLVNRSTYHVFTKFSAPTRYDFKQFYDILLDIEAARTSTSKYEQTQTYMREFNKQLNIISVGSIIAHFGIGTATSIEKLTINSFIDRIDFYVMQTNISFLLCLQNMNKLNVYLNNLKDQIVLKNESTVPIVRFYEHPFLI